MGHPAKNEYIDIFLIYGLSVCLIIIFSVIHFTPLLVKHAKQILPAEKTSEKAITKVITLFNKQAFAQVKVEGKAYIVYDLVNHEVIASKNELTILPLASVTKVMTAVSSLLHKSKNEIVTITPKSIEDGYDLGLKDHQVWKLSELLKYTLIFSSNDGAEAVADSFGTKEIFVTQMNNDAKILGLNLYFTDPAGRDIGGLIGGKGTALDVARLLV